MHVTNWAAAQREDPELDEVLCWLEAKKKTDLRTLLGEHTSSEEGQIVWRNCQNFMVLQDALYLHSMPKGRMRIYSLCGAKGAPDCHFKWVSSRCRTSSHEHTFSLLLECFWWPGMAKQMRQVIRACTHCLQYEVASLKPLYAP